MTQGCCAFPVRWRLRLHAVPGRLGPVNKWCDFLGFDLVLEVIGSGDKNFVVVVKFGVEGLNEYWYASGRLTVTQFARLLLVATLMVSIGGQWMVLQGVAWMGMAVSYSLAEGSVADGLSKTFDGEHPCPLCKAVKKATDDDGDSSVPGQSGKGKKKVELFSAATRILFAPDPMRLEKECGNVEGEALLMAPEAPPPKELV